MGREVRKVPKYWEHPKDENGRFIPLYERSYSESIEGWLEEREQWEKGYRRDFCSGKWIEKDTDMDYPFEEWSGSMPNHLDYMPDWSEEERTHLMMYEDTTQGTPISPAFEAPEELAKWLADNNASSFGSSGATYEQWLAMILEGWAPSMVGSPAGIQSGVEFAAND